MTPGVSVGVVVGKTAQEVRTPLGATQDYLSSFGDPDAVGITAQEKSPAWLRVKVMCRAILSAETFDQKRNLGKLYFQHITDNRKRTTLSIRFF